MNFGLLEFFEPCNEYQSNTPAEGGGRAMARALTNIEAEAMANSERLLKFAQETTKDLPQSVVSTLCSASEAAHTGAWDQKVATDFWIAFSALCAQIKPVTVDTLDATGQKIQPPKWRFWLRNPRSLAR